jgi:GT2 family glycosyltransferase
MSWSIMITSRRRPDDLRRTLARLSLLDPPPDEVLLHLDECGEPPSFPEYPFPLRVTHSSSAIGSVPARDGMIRRAMGDFVLSLDDDSYPEAPDFLATAETLWKDRPRTAVLWFPQRTDEFPTSLGQSDFGPELITGTFSSSGACLRREVYLRLPGYRREFFHAYEEPDYALQVHGSGWDVRFHPGLIIRHHYSTMNRNEIRTHHFHARNEIWSIWLACPALWVVPVTLRRAAGQFFYAWRRGLGWVMREPRWWLRAAAGSFWIWRKRRAVSATAYRGWMRLLRRPERIS